MRVRRTSGERALPFSTSAIFLLGAGRYCGHGAEPKVQVEGAGVARGAECRAQGGEECTLRAGGEKWPPFH